MKNKIKTIINKIIFNFKFNYAVKKGRLIDITYVPRGIGKTHKLIKLARKLRCPIVVKNKVTQDYYKHHYNFYNTYCESELKERGFRFDKLLIEEGVTQFRNIHNCCNKIVTGYYKFNWGN